MSGVPLAIRRNRRDVDRVRTYQIAALAIALTACSDPDDDTGERNSAAPCTVAADAAVDWIGQWSTAWGCVYSTDAAETYQGPCDLALLGDVDAAMRVEWSDTQPGRVRAYIGGAHSGLLVPMSPGLLIGSSGFGDLRIASCADGYAAVDFEARGLDGITTYFRAVIERE
jgi:hypothetical protein